MTLVGKIRKNAAGVTSSMRTLSRDKRFHCFAAESGELKWCSEKKFSGYASLVTNAGHPLALTAVGELRLIDLDPTKFARLDSKKTSNSPTWAHLAVCRDKLFIRELKGLTKWRWGG